MNITSSLTIALRNIRHGGQRTIVAVLCILFGVMSLIAMSALADSMSSTVLNDPRLRFGGDISLTPNTENHVTPEHLAMFETMHQSEQITAYMPLATNYALTLRTPVSGKLHFIQLGLGVDPNLFPLVGEVIMQEPGGARVVELLQEPGDILITRDLANELELTVGDTLIVGDLSSSITIEGVIRGIIAQTPDRNGGKILYGLDTAQTLAGSAAYLSSVVVTAPDPAAVQAKLEANGWSAFPLALYIQSSREVQDLWDLALKGAGILGLLVGGIGIANTMQVLLARRTRDIAIYKTLGYSQRDMLTLFMLEAAILGISGSVSGAAAGLLVSHGLVSLLERTTTFLIEWSVQPTTMIMSVVVGIATTLIFATDAIVRTSSVRPSALLRNEPLQLDTVGWAKIVGLWAALAVPFTAITTFILGTLSKGIGMVLFAIAGLLLLGGVFAALLLLVTWLIPTTRFPLLGISLSSLRRRGLSLVFAMIALFVGTVALTLSAVITQGAQRELNERTFTIDDYDLTILAAAADETEVRAALNGYPDAAVVYDVTVDKITAPGVTDGVIVPVLSGQAVLTDMQIIAGPTWQEKAAGVYVYPSDIPLGTEVTVTMQDGSQVMLPVVGRYRIDFIAPGWNGHFGLLMHPDTLLEIATPDRVAFHLNVPDAQLSGIATELGKTLPHAIVIDHFAFMNRFGEAYRNLFVLGVAMAGLALLAGVLLVANAVSLAVINRRYEIGVLKAVGYTRAHILRLFTVEYSIIGVIAAAAGVFSTAVTLLIIAAINDTAGELLLLDGATAVVMLLLTVALTVVTVLITGWKPAQLAPMVVLADRE